MCYNQDLLKLSVNPDSWLPRFCTLCKDEKSSCEICHQAVGVVCFFCQSSVTRTTTVRIPVSCLCAVLTNQLQDDFWLPVCMWYLFPCLLSLLPLNTERRVWSLFSTSVAKTAVKQQCLRSQHPDCLQEPSSWTCWRMAAYVWVACV